MLSESSLRQAPDFVPGVPHAVAHSRRYCNYTCQYLCATVGIASHTRKRESALMLTSDASIRALERVFWLWALQLPGGEGLSAKRPGSRESTARTHTRQNGWRGPHARIGCIVGHAAWASGTTARTALGSSSFATHPWNLLQHVVADGGNPGPRLAGLEPGRFQVQILVRCPLDLASRPLLLLSAMRGVCVGVGHLGQLQRSSSPCQILFVPEFG